MKKITAILIALAMLSIFVPGASALTKTAGYDVPSSPNGNLGFGLTTRPCATEWREWEGGLIGGDDDPTDPAAGEALTVATETGCAAVDPEGDGAVRIGVFAAAIQHTDDIFTNFVASVEDDNFDSTYFDFCITVGVLSQGDNICDNDGDDFSASGCGSNTINTGGLLSGGPENRPDAFIHGSFVDQDTLEVCLGSSGLLTITMS